jgi:hypothetical protein
MKSKCAVIFPSTGVGSFLTSNGNCCVDVHALGDEGEYDHTLTSRYEKLSETSYMERMRLTSQIPLQAFLL